MEQQSEVTRSDLLIDDTVQEILYRFDVDHSFPATFIQGGDDEQTSKGSWMSRFWQGIAAFLGLRPHAASAVRGEQGDGHTSRITVGP